MQLDHRKIPIPEILRKWREKFGSERYIEIYEYDGQIYQLDKDEGLSCIDLFSDEDKQILKDNPDCEVFSVEWNEDKSNWILEIL